MKRKMAYIVVISLLLLNGVASFSIAATNPDDTGDEPKQLQIQVIIRSLPIYGWHRDIVNVDSNSQIITIPVGSIYRIRVTSDGEPVGGAKVRLITRIDDGTVLGVGNAYYKTMPYGFVRHFFTAPRRIHDETVRHVIVVSKEGYNETHNILNFY